MKTAKEIKDRISEICTAFIFEYNNVPCGVDPFSECKFTMWYGENDFYAKSIDEVMNTPFFNGKCLTDIVDDIDIIDF